MGRRRKYNLSRKSRFTQFFLVKKKANTPSKRNFKFLLKLNKFKKITFLKLKIKGLKKKLGRSFGRIICRFRSFGVKKKYRKIENERCSFIHQGIFEHMEYNSTHSTFLARIFNPFINYHFYIRYPEGLKIGFFIKTNSLDGNSLGDSNKIINLPTTKVIHNLTLFNTNNISRSAGTFCLILQKYLNYSLILFPSKKILYVSSKMQATLGRLSNRGFKLCKLGKAGRKRLLGFRPHVRGVAMNPVDHPHGGGEGKTSGGVKTSVSFWGKPTKQIKKRKNEYFKKNKKSI